MSTVTNPTVKTDALTLRDGSIFVSGVCDIAYTDHNGVEVSLFADERGNELRENGALVEYEDRDDGFVAIFASTIGEILFDYMANRND